MYIFATALKICGNYTIKICELEIGQTCIFSCSAYKASYIKFPLGELDMVVLLSAEI